MFREQIARKCHIITLQDGKIIHFIFHITMDGQHLQTQIMAIYIY